MSAIIGSLDGRRFVLASSTASEVGERTTVFDYHETDGVVWGEYAGGTVRVGRFVGSREGSALRLSFVHRSTDDAIVCGSSDSTVVDVDGVVEIDERFTVDGSAGTSRVRELS